MHTKQQPTTEIEIFVLKRKVNKSTFEVQNVNLDINSIHIYYFRITRSMNIANYHMKTSCSEIYKFLIQ